MFELESQGGLSHRRATGVSTAVSAGALAILLAMSWVRPTEAVAVADTAASAARGSVPTFSIDEARGRLHELAVPWVANLGQWNDQAAWRAQSFAGAVWVTRDGAIVHHFNGPRTVACAAVEGDATSARQRHDSRICPRVGGWVLSERFAGGRIGAIVGREPLEGRVSFFVGEDPRHAADLPAHAALDLGEVFPGVTVELRARQANVEKLYTVAPGRDPAVIRMQLSGTPKLVLTKEGALEARTSHGPVRFTAPVAFQFDAKRERRDVAVRYALKPKACGPDCHEYGFELGAYDRSRPLVIDPLLQSTFHGGLSFEEVNAMAIHPASGEVYVVGRTASNDLPSTAGGAQVASGGNEDAFAARFNAALTARLQTTYLGGTGTDGVSAVAIHPVSGEIYVVGSTRSTDFPGTAGSSQPSQAGEADAFVTRFNAALTTRLQSSYLGGADQDNGHAVAIHPVSGEVYVAGVTFSTDFPGTAGSAQATFGGGVNDAFVTRFNSALTLRLQSTYLGGSANESARALSIHPSSGRVYVAGPTTSIDLPGTAGGAQATNGGLGDAFVTSFNSTLTVLSQSTYLGGSDFDSAQAIAIHPDSGDVYVAGTTSSTGFPGTIGGAQGTYGGGSFDTFVTRLTAALTTYVQSTYLGGALGDTASALAIHPLSGDVYVAGMTIGTSFPNTSGGAQSVHGGGSFDGYVARLNSALTAIHQATFLGGGDSDDLKAVAIHPSTGDVYVAGRTGSADFPGTTGGAQSAYVGGDDAFVSRLSADLRSTGEANLSITKTDGLVSVVAGGLVTYSITVANAGPSAADWAVFSDPAVANLTVAGVSCGSATGGAACPLPAAVTVVAMQGPSIVIPLLPSGGSVTFTVTGTAGAGGTINNTAYVTVPAGTIDLATANNAATDSTVIISSVPASVPVLALPVLGLLSLALGGLGVARLRRR